MCYCGNTGWDRYRNKSLACVTSCRAQMYSAWAFSCNLPPVLLAGWLGFFMCYSDNTGMDTEIRVSTESWPWRWKFSSHSCQDSNPQPFDHESGTLTTKLSLLSPSPSSKEVQSLYLVFLISQLSFSASQSSREVLFSASRSLREVLSFNLVFLISSLSFSASQSSREVLSFYLVFLISSLLQCFTVIEEGAIILSHLSYFPALLRCFTVIKGGVILSCLSYLLILLQCFTVIKGGAISLSYPFHQKKVRVAEMTPAWLPEGCRKTSEPAKTPNQEPIRQAVIILPSVTKTSLNL